MNGYREATADFVQGTKGVIGAVDMLRVAVVGGDPGDIEFASDILASAADGYTGNTAKHERLGFDEIAATPDIDLPKRERVASDLLASALVDIEVANTLIVAGRVAGETTEPASVEDLDAAASQLEKLTNVVALPLGRDVDVPVETARFGFDEVPSAVPTAPSSNLDMAKSNFEKRVMEVLKGLVTETQKILEAAFKGVDDLDEEKLAEAISMVGTAVELPQIGRLIAKGLTLAVQALQKLNRLLGQENVEALQKKAEEIIKQIKEGGDLLEKFLNYSYGVAEAKKRVRGLLEETSADIAQIDDGTKQLAELQTRFVEQMALVTRIVSGLSTGKKFVGMLLPEVAGVLLFGAFYLVAMDCAVLYGMDFADTTTLISFVEGVLKISDKTLS